MCWGLDTGPELEDSGWSSGELEDCPHFEELAASDNLQEYGAEDILQVWEAGGNLEGWELLDTLENYCSWSDPDIVARTFCTGWTGTVASHSFAGYARDACCPD